MYKDIFENWKNGVVKEALKKGIVDLDSIEGLCRKLADTVYREGYKEGDNEGYTRAVADIESEES